MHHLQYIKRKKLRFIQNEITDPFFNLALEEYLLRHVSYESCMLWQSHAAVVIGKHQNALAEVNFPFVRKEGIPVVRRLSGGGTVFHGPGNLNFSMIRKGESGKMIDFKKHTLPVISFLNDLGVAARFEGKNDLRVNGLKISGNAEHVYKNRVLHHGTLLFDTNLKQLNASIRVRPGRYVDKSVQSVRSRVANISGFLSRPMTFREFEIRLERYLKSFFQQEQRDKGIDADVSDHHLNDEEIREVQRLVLEKYATWEWNYGYSPDYSFFGSAENGTDILRLRLSVKKGIIEEAAFEETSLDSNWTMLAKNMVGKQHKPVVVLELLKAHAIVESEADEIPSKLVHLFF